MSSESSGTSGVLGWYFKTNLLLRILIGLIAGAVVGLIVGPPIEVIDPLGRLFVRLLNMIVVPVILFTLIVGAASVSPARLGRIGVKTVVLYLVTSALAIMMGLIMGNVFRPGAGMDLGTVEEGVAREADAPALVDTLLEIVPTNPFNAITSGDVLSIIFFAILFGIGLSYLQISQNDRIKSAADVMFRFFDGGAEIMYKIVGWVLEYAPIGVFALIAVVFGRQGAEAFGPLAIVTLAVYLALVLHLFIIYGGLLKLSGFGLFKFIRRAREAMITAFVSRSSGGTLPVTIRNVEGNMGVKRPVFAFSLPLGATINMDGTAIYMGVCVLFIANAIGVPLTIAQQVMVIVTAVLASIGTAGVPGAGAIMLLMVLQAVDLPVADGTPQALAYGMILGIDALLDMGRTGLNVTGDMAVTCVVAKSEDEIDLAKWEN
ncbi:MAG: dicarboxylate/amino acid:cation symporter [Spirochaetaceae bacterium]